MTAGLPLAGRVALVTAAAGPTARAIAVALAEAGAELVLTTGKATDAEEFAINSIGNELWALDRRYLTLVIDLDAPGAAAEAMRQSVAALGRLDAAIVHAGDAAPAGLLRQLVEQAQKGPPEVTVVALARSEAQRQELVEWAAGGPSNRSAVHILQIAPIEGPTTAARIVELVANSAGVGGGVRPD